MNTRTQRPVDVTTFATLGPAGSNHELVTKRYIKFHGLNTEPVKLVLDFAQAVQMVLDRRADYIIQCAAHPAVADTIGSHLKQIFIIDTFIAPSRELAVLSRRTFDRPSRRPSRQSAALGLHPATKSYIDHGRWHRLIYEQSIVSVAHGLLEGRYDDGITALAYAGQYPEKLQVKAHIGTVNDAWIVYGRDNIISDKLLAWPDSPAARLFSKKDRI